MPPITLLLITTAVLVLFIIVLYYSSIRIVPEYKRLVVFRLGRMIGARGPGLVLLLRSSILPPPLICASKPPISRQNR